ncbi:MAG TPA: hypothetical protein DD438_08980 [Verrucomicrobiales bacterium]|nr:hypothetical protein [Verrucomicrobiales bacterium]
MNNSLAWGHFPRTFVACEQNRSKRNWLANYKHFTRKGILLEGPIIPLVRQGVRDLPQLGVYRSQSVLPSEAM